MAKHSDKQRVLTRRAMIFGGIQLAGAATLASRLYYLQFIKNDEYRTLSENNRVKLQLLAPERGSILDRNGLPLALNEKNYLLFLDNSGLSKKELNELLQKAAELLQISDKKMQQLRDELRTNPYASPLLLKEHLSWEEVSKVELHQITLPGIYIDMGQLRYYPFEDRASHLIGYVGAAWPVRA
jgi:penicillin-binding protein 2